MDDSFFSVGGFGNKFWANHGHPGAFSWPSLGHLSVTLMIGKGRFWDIRIATITFLGNFRDVLFLKGFPQPDCWDRPRYANSDSAIFGAKMGPTCGPFPVGAQQTCWFRCGAADRQADIQCYSTFNIHMTCVAYPGHCSSFGSTVVWSTQ